MFNFFGLFRSYSLKDNCVIESCDWHLESQQLLDLAQIKVLLFAHMRS